MKFATKFIWHYPTHLRHVATLPIKIFVRLLKCNMVAFLQCLLNICRKFEYLISQGSVAIRLRCGGHCGVGFVASFISFPVVKNFENELRFDKVAESLKVGTFLRHSVGL